MILGLISHNLPISFDKNIEITFLLEQSLVSRCQFIMLFDISII